MDPHRHDPLWTPHDRRQHPRLPDRRRSRRAHPDPLGRRRSRPRRLIDTPARVARSYRELFAGYEVDPREYLERTFQEVGGYDELVILKDIRFVSFCEHHMLPVVGKAHVAYLPTDRVVGISKLARVVRGFARRLQIQEKMTADIARTIHEVLRPEGVGVIIEAEHSCMTMRGVDVPGASLITSHLIGVVRDDPRTREEFMRLARG
ncbi:GTP cyclohydrolase I type 1 [Brevundimonas abyssalis TAR-001]|uniref:GTP cyclohydrolase 1 n=1 Tax=Brevundimonas abyssalis TAR-001 TaxID=1391729 RepID=A0A8E0NAA8_9CAUL|nr:GTP cyclohydrolase I type 1 [Brevundimonas abyssalis TAR-001]